MKKVLIAIDDTKGSKSAVSGFLGCIRDIKPLEVVLLHVQKLEGRSLIDEMLGEPEMATLREAVKDSDVQALLDRKAEQLFAFYRAELGASGVGSVKAVVRSGHPADEILAVASAEGVDMIVVGARSSRSTHRFMGSVSQEVAERSEIPVLIVKHRETL